MKDLLILSTDHLRQALPMIDAIAVMKEAFAALSQGDATVPLRTAIEVPAHRAVALTMPAHLPGRGLGAKLVSVFPGNREQGKAVVNGLVVALDPSTGEPIALTDGTFLTAWRTGAASGAATDLLARPDARTAAVMGCGAQARTQILAIDAVRELDEIRLYARTESSVVAFVEDMAPQVQGRLVACTSPQQAVDSADIVCTATTSSTPVFDGADLAPGCHLNGVGSYTATMQEIDTKTVARSRVFVDQRLAALTEAGDLLIAEQQGVTQRDDWTELGEVINGTDLGRRGDDEITFFKSVGNAVQDIAALAQAVERCQELGLGYRLEM